VVNEVNAISQLIQEEPASLDHEQIASLYAQLGTMGAEDVIRRAMEELALRLSHLERQYRQGEFEELRKGARSLIAIAKQIGMQQLATVSENVCHAIDRNDTVAIAATLARLLRMGERSLLAVWELQDLSV